MLVRQLLNPTDAQLERATRVLFETVGYDELPLAGCGFDRSILWDNFYARVSYGCRDGWVYVIGKAEDSIDGVAYINAAGSSYGDSPSSPGGPPKFRERVRPEIKEWHQAFYFPWFDSFCNRAFDDLGISMKGSLYVNLLGVDPSIQGKGYGYALMKKMLELAKEQKVDLTLISDLEKNTRWYERLGLEVTIRDDVDVWEIGSRPCWGMVKRYKE